MRVIDARAIDRALDFPNLVEALAEAFRGGAVTPARAHHEVERGGAHGTLLIMPAWVGAPLGGYIGTKVVTIFPGNSAKGVPSLLGTYLLMDGATGAPLAALDGARLTLWRTAAASALAARYLVRPDASRMLMVGAGALASFLIRAHLSRHPFSEVAIWNRRPERADALASDLAAEGLPVVSAHDLEAAAGRADLVTCATLATEPVVRGAWLKPGTHLDLVGAFTPAMREADDDALRRGSLYIDTPLAKTEGGDLALAIRSGAITEASIRGDLAGLCRGEIPGRQGADEVTVFKSVGTALEDLTAAIAVWQSTPAST